MAKIEAIDNDQVVYGDLIQIYKHELTTKLHIVIAPTKNKTRFEWLLEKVTEIGVDTISPIICDHSERTKINQLRCEKVLISAMKQSKNAKRTSAHTTTNATNFQVLGHSVLSILSCCCCCCCSCC